MTLTWPRPNRVIGVIDALGIVGLLGLLTARFIPVARLPFWTCVLRRDTGWPCMGCGLTRAADHFSHLQLAQAWHANPLGTLAAAGFAACIVLSALHMAFKLPLPDVTLSDKEKTAVRVLVVVAVAVNYAYVVVATKFPQLLAGG